MPNVTLVWVSTKKSGCRTISLSKPVIYTAVCGVLFLLCMPIAGSLWVNHAYQQVVRQQQQYHLLQDQLTQKDRFLQTQVRTTQNLQQEKQLILDQLHTIQNTENKIRRFLGLNERPHILERSHQGGMGPLSGVQPLAQTTITTASLTPGRGETFFDYSQSLRDGLHEVLDHLNEQRLLARRIPTLLPVASDKAWLSGHYGWRNDPISGDKRDFHYGVDIAGPWKSRIIAPADAKVVKVSRDTYLGIYVKLEHTDQIQTLYGHLAVASVKAGQTVKRGDVIGIMGNTGRSTGTHLHYGVVVDGKYVNPLDFVWDHSLKSLKL
jgi:murein DD-endopeptidase MepM/ murein hydrolase activator NlpD